MWHSRPRVVRSRQSRAMAVGREDRMQGGIAMKKNRKSKVRKLEKKRRAERGRRRQKAEPLAYRGNKYKTDALVPVVFATESRNLRVFRDVGSADYGP